MPILEVDGLVKYYGRRLVVNGVSFQVERGEIVGLLGPNGAGKTTSFRMATGQITPHAGRVLLGGKDVTALAMYLRAREGMGYLDQQSSIFRKLTVEQNILAILEALPRHRTLGRKLTRAERWEFTDRVLAQFGLTHLRKNSASRLSGGEKRRLEIARCLVCDPLLILLDEPFAGIDPPTIADIKSICRELARQGIAILVTDHQAREILSLTDRIYIIKGGEVRTQGTPSQIVRDPIALAEYLGQDFNSHPFAGPVTGAETPPSPPAKVVSEVLEQERIHRLIECLKSPEGAAAAEELAARGRAVVPALLEALERRDVELRRQALAVLQRVLAEEVGFDPYAPETLRRHQLLILRERLARRAA